MTGKGLLAIGLAVIAGVFLALVIQARSSDSGAELGHKKRGRLVERADRGNCATAVDHALDAAGARVEDMYGAGARTRVRLAATQLCVDDSWPEDVRRCLYTASDASALSRCVGELPAEAHSHLMAELERIPRADDSLQVAPPPPPDPDVYGGTYGTLDAADDLGGVVGGVAGGAGLPDECLEYGTLIEKMASCDKLPQTSRTAMRDAYAQMKSAWQGMAATGDTRDAMATGCREAAKAMKQAMSSLCP